MKSDKKQIPEIEITIENISNKKSLRLVRSFMLYMFISLIIFKVFEAYNLEKLIQDIINETFSINKLILELRKLNLDFSDQAGIIALILILGFSFMLPLTLDYFINPTKIISIQSDRINIKGKRNKIEQTLHFSILSSINLVQDERKGDYLELTLKEGEMNCDTIFIGKNYGLPLEFVKELKEKIDQYMNIYIKGIKT